MALVEPPSKLPVEHLSLSSVSAFLRCPEKWRRRYIDREYESPSGKMILGSAVGAAEAFSDHAQIDTGERLTTDAVVDLFSDEWDDRTEREDVDWGSDKPGELKDSGVGVISAYDKLIGPSLEPVSVEREFSLQLDGADWVFTGFLDLELADDTIADRKVRGKRLSQADADQDLQPASYMVARRAEGNPAKGFAFHAMVRTKQPSAEVVPTTRTDAQLDVFTGRLVSVAAEIAWRAENDHWQYAPPMSWFCSERMCGYWFSCPGGGLK